MRYIRTIAKTLLLVGIASGLFARASLAQDVVTYYHTDLTGSTVAGSDSNGNVIWREDYTPYGEKRLEQLSSGDNRRAYTGHPHEDFTGLTYAGARHYEPMTGRFMSADPSGPNAERPFTFNRYAYADNNPYRNVDPDGRETAAVTVQSLRWMQGDRRTESYCHCATDVVTLGFFAAPFAGVAAPELALVLARNPHYWPILSVEGAWFLSGVPGPSPLVGGGATKNAASLLQLEKQLASEAGLAEVLSNQGTVMAGAGVRKQIGDLARILQEHGGKASDWAKVTSKSHRLRNGDVVSVHAYEDMSTGMVVEPKAIVEQSKNAVAPPVRADK